MNKILAIDLGGTAIKYGLADKEGHLFSTGKISTPKESFDQFLHMLDSIVIPVLNQICGIAMSMPGRVDNLTGHIHTGGAVSSYMTDVPLGSILQKRYHLPIAIENDGKCAAHAELWKGSLKDDDSGAVIIIGYGIGGGIVLDRKVWRGIHHSAGEFSYLVTDYKHGSDDCAYWNYSNGINGLLAPYAIKKGIPLNQLNGEVFFEALHQDDQDAKECFENYIQYMLSGILTLQGILDVETFCIGGGISIEECLIESVRKAVNDYFDSAPEYIAMIRPQIKSCYFKNDANLIGAVKNFINIYG